MLRLLIDHIGEIETLQIFELQPLQVGTLSSSDFGPGKMCVISSHFTKLAPKIQRSSAIGPKLDYLLVPMGTKRHPGLGPIALLFGVLQPI